MQIPERLEDWTLPRIKQILKSGACENDRFDFKECLPHDNADGGKFRLRKTVAAFANSGGGFLIFGVKDSRRSSADARIVGIPAIVEFSQHFGPYPGKCEPSVEWHARAHPIQIDKSGSLLHVIEIASTWRRPHAVMQDGAAYFMKRTSDGDMPMSFSEIAASFRESEFRRTGLALLVSELDHMRATAEQLIEESGKTMNIEASPDKPWTWATRYSTTLLDITLGNTYPFFSTDPELWKCLCIVREKARWSNATSEGFTSAVFFRISERVAIHDSRVRELINCARAIVSSSKDAVDRLKRLQ